MSAEVAEAAVCEHHWIHRAQPNYPEWLAFIAYCSMCNHFGELDLRAGWAVVRVEPEISCDCCSFTSTDPDDFADLGGDRQFGGVLTAYPCQCHTCAHTPGA